MMFFKPRITVYIRSIHGKKRVQNAVMKAVYFNFCYRFEFDLVYSRSIVFLALVFFFLIFIENLCKVQLRRPY